MSLTKASYSMIYGAPFNVLDYGAYQDGTNVVATTAAINSAISAAFNAGGGTVFFPAGIYAVSQLSLNWNNSPVSIIFKGAGENATIIKKGDATTSAVFALSATSGTDGIYSEFRDFTVDGNSVASNGISINIIARTTFHNVHIKNCTSAGINNSGSLILAFYDCNLFDNNIGYLARASGSFRCNLVQFFGGAVRGNTSWGFDIGDTSGFHIYGTDIESNGTSGGIGGALLFRSTCGTEYGNANASVNGAWFEANYGYSIETENATGLILGVYDTPILASEGGHAASIGTISSVVLENVTATSPGDTVTINATNLVIRNSRINTIAGVASNRLYEALSTGTNTYKFYQEDSSGNITLGKGQGNTGSGEVTAVSATPTTIFSADFSAGLYEVFVFIANAGSNYMATARVGYDGTNAIRLGGEDGANMSITLSGLNVQITQSSGSSQQVLYRYWKIG